MALQRMHISARYIEELIDFFMKEYHIDWIPPHQLSKNHLEIPGLFTLEMGRTVFAISQSYQYRRMVEASVIYQYLEQEGAFYRCVLNMSGRFLNRLFKTSFFHMSAFAAEVAVFCQLQSRPNLHSTLIAAIMCLCDLNLDLKNIEARGYYQLIAQKLDRLKTKRMYESNDFSANKDRGESSFFKYNSANQIVSQLHQSGNANSSNHQIPRFGQPYCTNCFSGSQFVPTLPSSYPNSALMYPRFRNAHFDPMPVPSWNNQRQLNMVDYVHPNFTYGSSVASGETVNSEYNAIHDPRMFPSNIVESQIVNTFSLNADSAIKLPSPQSINVNSLASSSQRKSKQKSQPLNVNAPVFIHSSKTQETKSPLTAASTAKPEDSEST